MATESAAIVLRAAPVTIDLAPHSAVVGWLRRGEKLVVAERKGNRVRCQKGWASVAVGRTGTPLLRLIGRPRSAAPLAVSGQRRTDLPPTPAVARVLASQTPLSTFFSSGAERPGSAGRVEQAVGDVLSVSTFEPPAPARPHMQALSTNLPPQPRRSRAAIGKQEMMRAGRAMAVSGDLRGVRAVVKRVGDAAVVSPDAMGMTLLHHAAGGGQADIVRFLLTQGALATATDSGDNTPLMHAAVCPDSGAAVCAATLLASGADHNQLNERQLSAAHLAASHGHPAVLEILLGAGARTGGRAVPLGRTPLHFAAENDHAGCTQMLLDAGADANARTADGLTPLHSAAWRGALEPMQLLLRAGSDPAATTREDHTPLDLAAGFGHKHCAQMLQYAKMLGPEEPLESTADLYVFPTPEQLVEEGEVRPLDERTAANLSAVAACLQSRGDHDGDDGASFEPAHAVGRAVSPTAEAATKGRAEQGPFSPTRAVRQRSAPALTQPRGAGRARSRRRGSRARPRTAGPATAAAVAARADVVSLQGTVQAATLGWGAAEWEGAICQYKLAPAHAPPAAGGAGERMVRRPGHRSVRSASAAESRLRSPQRAAAAQRPHSAAALAVSMSSDLSLGWEATDAAPLRPASPTRRPASAIPSTMHYQSPGVEQAAAALTPAEQEKRQRERLASAIDNGAAEAARRAADLSRFHVENPQERSEREVAEEAAATRIQARVRGRAARVPVPTPTVPTVRIEPAPAPGHL